MNKNSIINLSSINSTQLLEITLEVNGVSKNAQLKAIKKKANIELKNKKE